MTDKTKYARIEDNASDYEVGYPNSMRQPQRWISTLSSFFLGLVTMGAVMAAYSAFILQEPLYARKLPHAPNGSDPNTGLPLAWSHGDCGNSPEVAKERGCQYSIVLHSWLPQSCLTEADIEDSREMYMNRSWPYETASGRNLTMEDLGAGDYGYFTTTFDWHVTHCMYVWKRLHRILLDPTQELDSYTANYHHTSHCVRMIGGLPEGMKDSGTKIFVKYPKCAK